MLEIVLLALAGLVLVLIAAGMAYERLAEAADARRFPAPGRLVDVGGRRIHLNCLGDAAGPTVVIEQGASSASLYWSAVQRRIAGFARVCTYDRAGMLWSDPAKGRRSMADRVADLSAVLERGGVPGPYVLVGHSYGGLMIRMYAKTHPERTAGLVIVDAPDEAVVDSRGYRRLGGFFRLALGVMGAASHVGLMRLAGGRAAGDPPEGLARQTMAAIRAMEVRPGFFDVVADEIRSLSGPKLDCGGPIGDRPVAVITHGVPFPGPFAFMEKMWPAAQQRLLALSTDSVLLRAEKANHMIPLEEPDVIVDAVRRVWTATRDGTRVNKELSAEPSAN